MNASVQHDELIGLVLKRLSDQAEETEVQKLDKLLQDQENRKIADQISALWEQSANIKGFTAEEVKKEWNRLEQAIDLHESTAKSGFSLLKIAAVIALIIMAGIATYVVSNRTSQTVVLAESIQAQTMGDGSVITLFTDARLSFGKEYNNSDRRVKLEGEAFFEVNENLQKPFIVKTSHVEVMVVGTSFNVVATSSKSEVTVRSGTVRISSKGQTILLEAGETGVYTAAGNKLFELQNEDPNFDAWRTRSFQFDDDSLQNVIRLLNKAYGTSLYIENEELLDCPITVSFYELPLDDILEILGSTLSLQFESTINGILITGSGC